ncbi:GGT1 [Branchiostoma lanceolatum]|uniref:GGT1 protein n=1 Tax=Branchiostoma lanceolatum TaxID=7740 RepID=A0A8J9YPR1_BRALA|nr:GGT1 [Branchiostoma lanceolatum]
MGAFVKVLYVVVGAELAFFVFLALLDQQRDQVGLDGNGADQVDVDVPDELFEHGAVASDAATCSEIGREIVDDDNNVLTENDVIQRPQLAVTLRAVADGGADAFYTGEIAKNLVKDIQGAGGSMTEEDLANYRVKVTRPLNISLPGGLFLLTSPAPSGGPILSLTLNILEGYALNASAIDDDDNKALTYHRMIEAFQVASDQGNLLGDQTFLNSEQITARMTSKPFAASLRSEMDTSRSRATRSANRGSVFATTNHRGTHVSVLGPNNDAVSITTGTSSTGRQCLSTSTGIILNSHTSPRKQRTRRGRPNPANIVRPGERPRTAMSPTIIVDSRGDVKLVIGASGGQQLIPTLAETIVRYLWLGMNLTSAIEKPRLLPADDGISFKYEKDRPFKPEAVLNQLEREYGRAAPEENQATVEAVARENSAVFAHSDSRNGGFPSGF